MILLRCHPWPYPLSHIRPNSRLCSSPFQIRRNTSAPGAAASPAVHAASSATKPAPSASAVEKAAGIASIHLPRRLHPRRVPGPRLKRAVRVRRRKVVTSPARSRRKTSGRWNPSSMRRSPMAPSGWAHGHRPRVGRARLDQTSTGRKAASHFGSPRPVLSTWIRAARPQRSRRAWSR